MLVRLLIVVVAASFMGLADHSATRAETCTKDTLRRVVDEAGARLRVLTSETQPRIMAALRRLKEKRGWSSAEADDKASALIADERTSELDAKASTLLARIDELAETSSANDADCSRLAELEATSLELQATVRAKSQHILARLEQEAGGGAVVADKGSSESQSAPAARPSAPARQVPRDAADRRPVEKEAPRIPKEPPAVLKQSPAPKEEARVTPAPQRDASAQSVERQSVERQPLPPPPENRQKASPATGWSTETSERLPSSAETAGRAPQAIPTVPPETTVGFSREEIAEASRGFFGTISGGLATVIEHAFSTLGRPSGYVLGSEGGGAFIAGLRYGKGTLFLLDGSKREVFWHGPSIGYDIGAAGSKTMFLVYNLKSDVDIFTGYSGVDGSAYLVGGVGMTLLTDGKVVMAPIRSGLGLRLGASIGYIRFTPRPTWNPF